MCTLILCTPLIESKSATSEILHKGNLRTLRNKLSLLFSLLKLCSLVYKETITITSIRLRI